jgi:hypothetical protein
VQLKQLGSPLLGSPPHPFIPLGGTLSFDTSDSTETVSFHLWPPLSPHCPFPEKDGACAPSWDDLTSSLTISLSWGGRGVSVRFPLPRYTWAPWRQSQGLERGRPLLSCWNPVESDDCAQPPFSMNPNWDLVWYYHKALRGGYGTRTHVFRVCDNMDFEGRKLGRDLGSWQCSGWPTEGAQRQEFLKIRHTQCWPQS